MPTLFLFSALWSRQLTRALTRDRVLHFIQRKKKFYSLHFHVIYIKHFFQCKDCYIILKSIFLRNTWDGQQYQYLKHGDNNPVANKKITLGQVVTNFTWQVVTNCVCGCMCAFVCVCVLQRHSRIHHTSPETIHLYVYIRKKCSSFL